MSMGKRKRDELDAALIQEIGSADEGFSVGQFAAANGISAQTVYKHLHDLTDAGMVSKKKSGRRNLYTLVDHQSDFRFLIDGLKEDIVWNRDVRPLLEDMPQIAKKNCGHAFTEMLNNAIEHSGGTEVLVRVRNNGYRAEILIADDGIGIFTKISEALNLSEKRFAILELAKGKFTTDPQSHTGEGIFFSSKAVDTFAIVSDQLIFLGPSSVLPPYLDKSSSSGRGTLVVFDILFSHSEPLSDVFDRYTKAPDDYGFSKTIVPVRLLEYGDDTPMVVSRSQARRLMTRFERFERIVLDFSGIDEIGQGFADELFRVFPQNHPGTILQEINCSDEVRRMIEHARSDN